MHSVTVAFQSFIAFVYRYSKEEHIAPGSLRNFEFTHLIAEAKSRYSANLKPYVSTHDILDTIEAFHQITFNYISLPPVSIKTKPVLYILRRRENYKEFLKNITATVPYIIESEESEEDLSATEERIETIKIAALKEEPKTTKKETSTPEIEVLHSEQEILKNEEALEPYPKIVESKESSKDKEKISSSENRSRSNDKQQHKSIKKSIRKLISKYRRIKTEKTDSKSSSDSNNVTKKISVKQLIKQEKANIEKEELQKIQQQVISLIENNPNIVNKDIIKEKIETTVMKELTSAIEPDISDQLKYTKPPKDLKKRILSESIIPSESKKIAVEKSNKTLKLGFGGKHRKEDTSKANGEEKKKYLIDEKPKSLTSPEESISKGDFTTVEENAIDIYENPDQFETEEHEEAPDFTSNLEVNNEADISTQSDIEEKLQLASEQIENLMTIISEIVDTIEVTDEYKEEEEEER